jgi:membrane protease YdiL (CAAX protease family)
MDWGLVQYTFHKEHCSVTTLIGQPLREHPEALCLMAAVCVIVFAVDWSVSQQHRHTYRTYVDLFAEYERVWHSYETHNARYETVAAAGELADREYERYCKEKYEAQSISFCLAFLVFFLYPALVNGRISAVGLNAVPSGGWRSWCLIAVLLALLTALLAIPLAALWWLCGGRLDDLHQSDWHYGGVLVEFGVRAPLVEELIFRMGLCPPVAAWLGPRTAIAVSGILFGLSHIAYGGANPVNLVAGFLLAWAFLKSNTILVPLLLHALGNLVGWWIVTEFLLPLPHA